MMTKKAERTISPAVIAMTLSALIEDPPTQCSART